MAESGAIKHVFVLMLENRSVDHMLGFSGLKGNDPSGKPTGIDGLTGDETNVYQPPTGPRTTYGVSQPADWQMPVDPNHDFLDVLQQLTGRTDYTPGGPYPPIDNSGFVQNYAPLTDGTNLGEILKCYEPDQLPVLTSLAAEFALCDHWWSSLPGPTWPNRFFAHAASSGGLDHSPSVAEMLEWETVYGFRFKYGTLFDALNNAGLDWQIYAGDWTPNVGALKGIWPWDINDYSSFHDDVTSDDYTAPYTWIEPSYGDILSDYTCGTSQHPQDDVTRGEQLIKCTYESLRASPLWEKSMLIVTYDEHGGFYDHVAPGPATPPGDTKPSTGYNRYGFTFDTYGVRVPAVVVSPLIPQATIDHRTYDHASIPATVQAAFGLSAMTDRDAKANSVLDLAKLEHPRPTPTELPPARESGLRICDPLPPCGEWRALLEQPPPPPRPVTRPEDSINEGNLPGVIHVAVKLDLAVSPPEEHEQRVERARMVRTRADAREYLLEVRERVAGAEPPARD